MSSNLDAQALLRAVAETPDDDLPRLAYADWCEENGELGRGQFVRWQMGRGEKPKPIRWREWFDPWWNRKERGMGFRTLHAGLSCVITSRLDRGRRSKMGVERGFVSWVEISMADWKLHGPALVRKHPLIRVDTSRSPYWRHGGGIWEENAGSWSDAWPRYDLPPEVYKHLPRDTSTRQVTGEFRSPDEAERALSLALILWAWTQEPK